MKMSVQMKILAGKGRRRRHDSVDPSSRARATSCRRQRELRKKAIENEGSCGVFDGSVEKAVLAMDSAATVGPAWMSAPPVATPT